MEGDMYTPVPIPGGLVVSQLLQPAVHAGKVAFYEEKHGAVTGVHMLALGSQVAHSERSEH